MIRKKIAITCLAAAVAVPPAAPVLANDGIVGGIIGGIIGGAIVRESQRPRAATPSQPPRQNTANTAQRQSNRDVQASLNYFGFNAGTVDGVFGRNTRTAISAYQIHMGYVPTGELTVFERDFLVTSYQRAMAGGPVTAQLVASNPMGTRGLLHHFRDEMMGTPAAAQPAAPALPATPAPQPVAEQPAPAPAPAPAAPGLPNFLGAAVVQASLASHCNRVSLVTGSNGGFVTVANLTDPMQALEEQFCLARTYAIDEGDGLAAKLPGVTPQQVAEQCAGLAPALQPQVAALSVLPADQVLVDVGRFIAGSGMAPVQLAGNARICLGSGYRTDSMDVALASALILTGLGERGFGELLGHHLVTGFGTGTRSDLALPWYDMAVEVVQAGGRSPFAPGQAERAVLIRAASNALVGRSALPKAEPQPAGLPAFAVPQQQPAAKQQ